MAVFNANTGGISNGSQEFAGTKKFEPINITGVSGFSGFSGMGAGTGTIKLGNGNNANSSVLIPIMYEGTQYWVPGFASPTPA